MIKRIMALLLGIMLCFSIAIPAAADVPVGVIGTDFPEDTEFVFLMDESYKVYVTYPAAISAGAGLFVYPVNGDTFPNGQGDVSVQFTANGVSRNAVKESDRNKTLVAYDPFLATDTGGNHSPILDFWPKHVELTCTPNSEPLSAGGSVKLEAKIVNAKGQHNKACEATYTVTITSEEDGSVETLPAETTSNGTASWPTVTLKNGGKYTIECTAAATNDALKAEGGNPIPLARNVLDKKTVDVQKLEQQDPMKDPTSSDVPDSDFEVKNTIDDTTEEPTSFTIPIGNTGKNAVEVSFDGGETWVPAEKDDNGDLVLKSDNLTKFIENKGIISIRYQETGTHKPSTGFENLDLSRWIDGYGEPIALTDGTQASPVSPDVTFKITSPIADCKFEYQIVKKDSTTTARASAQPDPNGTWTPCVVSNGEVTVQLPQENSITQSAVVFVRYTHDPDRLLYRGMTSANLNALGGEEVTFIHDNGSIVQTSTWPNKPNTTDTYLVAKGDTMTFQLLPNTKYVAKDAIVTSGDAKIEYDPDKNEYTLTVNGPCEVTAIFRKPEGDGDFIPGLGDTAGTTGTTGSKPVGGTTLNPWLLGGTGGTTAQSGAQTVAGFSDVPKSAYYAEAVLWAVNNNITKGTSATTFSPNASCTRAQMVTFLWRQAGSPEPSAANNPFSDVTADQYYYKAVLWAVGKGITNGTSATTFSPSATVTRAQSVTFIWRNAGKPDAGTGKTFTDVTSGPYSDAINWAAARGVTQGTSAATFSPSNPCTRGQIVTFMYRAI